MTNKYDIRERPTTPNTQNLCELNGGPHPIQSVYRSMEGHNSPQAILEAQSRHTVFSPQIPEPSISPVDSLLATTT